MIIHASKEFAKRFKCKVSGTGHTVLQTGRPDAWSAHCFNIDRRSAVLFMNDATLYSVIFAPTGLKDFESVLAVFLAKVAAKWSLEGADFDAMNQSVIVLPRSNKSLMGSMNDAIRCLTIRYQHVFDHDQDPDWSDYEPGLNATPYKAIQYKSPEALLREMLRSRG